MRALRLLALAAAFVVPAAAAHAQYGVYVGPTPVYAAADYGWVPGHWDYNGYGRFWVPAHRIGGFYGRPHYERPPWRHGYYGWRGYR